MHDRSPLCEATLHWQRRRWHTSAKLIASFFLGIGLLCYVYSGSRSLVDLFRGPDKLHGDIVNSTLGVRFAFSFI